MSAFPCANKMPCDCTNDPVGNLTAEGYDQRSFYREVYPTYSAVDGQQWNASCCAAVCTSDTSQEEADLCAYNTALLGASEMCAPVTLPDGSVQCIGEGTFDGTGCSTCDPVVPAIYWNTEQWCPSTCPDGTIYWSYVPAHTFSATSQEAADAIAHSYACRLAATIRICLIVDNTHGCVGSSFTCLITAQGSSVPPFWIWSSLPAGLSFEYYPAAGLAYNQARITGTPTANGPFTVTVRATTPVGTFAQRDISLRFLEITAADPLPDGQVGVSYSYQLTAAGGSGTYTWSIASGALPAGLSLSAAGLVSGTPTTEEAGLFTIQVCDNNF